MNIDLGLVTVNALLKERELDMDKSSVFETINKLSDNFASGQQLFSNNGHGPGKHIAPLYGNVYR